MLLLTSTSDLVQLVTSAAGDIQVHASWVDNNAGTITPGRLNTAIATATTTAVVPSPAASTQRNVKALQITNNHAASSCFVEVRHTDGTTPAELIGVTLLPGENLGLREDGSWIHRDANGAGYTGAQTPSDFLAGFGIAGTVAESMPRMMCSEANLAALTSGTLFLQAIYLRAGQKVSNLSFHSATTAAGTPTNGFFALYDQNRALLAQSANFTTEAWAANSIKTKALAAAYTATYTGIHYVGIMVTATTVPTLKGLTAKTGGQLAGQAPILHGNSTTALTTSLPNPAAAITVGVNALWCAAT
ncbi:MAG: hypothetical protein ABL896_17335 [Hylemonella sp.]